MLIPNSIPDSEPILRVGIILPEDNQKTVILDTENSPAIKVFFDGKKVDIQHKLIVFEAKEDSIYFNGFETKKIEIFQQGESDFITVKSVIAGRGFHWAKHIEVKLSHTLEICIDNGNFILINKLPIEEYLASVATSEMSAECPETYTEAQTIVARSWMLANVEQKHIHLGFDVCNDDCCQRFQGINHLTAHSKKAAKNTRGQVLMYRNKIVDARYSKSCGGVMERFENLWENTPKDYMQNISDAPNDFGVDLTQELQLKKWVRSTPKSFCSPHYIKEEELHKYLGNVDVQSNYFRWKIETTQKELVENIRDKLEIDIENIIAVTPVKRAGSGRILKLSIEYIDSKGLENSITIIKDYEVRRVLHKMFLYSSAIDIEAISITDSPFPDKFVFTGAGWGHGAGLCQIGGIGMSIAGYSTEEIVKHYYPGVILKKIYE